MLQPKLKSVQTLPDFKILLSYENGENRVFDVTPYISGPWFGELRDRDYFNTIRLLPNGIGIEWPNGQDIAPHELYESSIAQ